MGYLTDISYSSDSAKDVHLRTQNIQNKYSYIASAASSMAPQVLGSLTSIIGRCLNGSENKTEVNPGKVNDADDAKRKELNKELSKALKKLGFDNLSDFEKNIDTVTKTGDVKSEKISEQVLEIQEIVNQLNALNFVGSTEETKKVEAQANELSSFNNAFDEYKKNPTKETALALQEAFQDCPIDSPYYRNYQKLYSLNKTKIEELIKS